MGRIWAQNSEQNVSSWMRKTKCTLWKVACQLGTLPRPCNCQHVAVVRLCSGFRGPPESANDDVFRRSSPRSHHLQAARPALWTPTYWSLDLRLLLLLVGHGKCNHLLTFTEADKRRKPTFIVGARPATAQVPIPLFMHQNKKSINLSEDPTRSITS